MRISEVIILSYAKVPTPYEVKYKEVITTIGIKAYFNYMPQHLATTLLMKTSPEL
jgi:hypothetical protein